MILGGTALMVLGVIFRHTLSGFWAGFSRKNAGENKDGYNIKRVHPTPNFSIVGALEDLSKNLEARSAG